MHYRIQFQVGARPHSVEASDVYADMGNYSYLYQCTTNPFARAFVIFEHAQERPMVNVGNKIDCH